MIIVIDSNIVIAALIKDATTKKLIIDLYPDIYFPQVMTEEISKYKELIKKKAKMDEQKFKMTFEKLFKYIKLVPDETIYAYKPMAQKMMEEIDPKDHTLIAAALSFENAIIWSNDPHLKKQTKIKTYTTTEMLAYIEKFLNQKHSAD